MRTGGHGVVYSYSNYALFLQEAQHTVGQRAATQSLNPGTINHHPATNLPSQETDNPEVSVQSQVHKFSPTIHSKHIG